MLDNFLNKLKEKYILICIFLLVFFMSYLLPYSGDEYVYSFVYPKVVRAENFVDKVENIFDVFKLIKSEKSNYIKIRNIVFDIAQTLLIFLKLLNYSKLTWIETFIPLYISIGMLIATAEIYFSLKNKIKKVTKKGL